MWAQVQVLRRKGARLKDAELAPPVEGELSIAFQQLMRDGRPPIRVATLKTATSGLQDVCRGLLLPLFDARLLDLEGDAFRLAGIELDREDGTTSEHVQIWRCRLHSRSFTADLPT